MATASTLSVIVPIAAGRRAHPRVREATAPIATILIVQVGLEILLTDRVSTPHPSSVIDFNTGPHPRWSPFASRRTGPVPALVVVAGPSGGRAVWFPTRGAGRSASMAGY